MCLDFNFKDQNYSIPIYWMMLFPGPGSRPLQYSSAMVRLKWILLKEKNSKSQITKKFQRDQNAKWRKEQWDKGGLVTIRPSSAVKSRLGSDFRKTGTLSCVWLLPFAGSQSHPGLEVLLLALSWAAVSIRGFLIPSLNISPPSSLVKRRSEN